MERNAVLIVGPSWVGDMVMAQALFMRLRQRRPDVAIDVLAPRWSLPILQRMPEVRAAIEMPLGHGEFEWFARRRLGRELRAHGYAQAIVLPGSWKSALAPWFARVPCRTGYRGEMRYGLLNDIRRLDQAVLRTTAQRFVALAEGEAARFAATGRGAAERPAKDGRAGPSHQGWFNAMLEIPRPHLITDPARGRRLADALGLPPDRPAVALMPGAEYGPAKRWPPEYYGQLAAWLSGDGAQVWVFGSAKEQALGAAIREASQGAAVNLCGRTELVDVVDLLALCRAAVTNDSGLMHVAAASGVPVVAIYGSSDPEHTPPLTEKHAIHYLRLDCSPCFERTCPLIHYNCLRGIAPEAVRRSVLELAGI